jgi:hypothetical protein
MTAPFLKASDALPSSGGQVRLKLKTYEDGLLTDTALCMSFDSSTARQRIKGKKADLNKGSANVQRPRVLFPDLDSSPRDGFALRQDPSSRASRAIAVELLGASPGLVDPVANGPSLCLFLSSLSV